jgi:hypothetical protein
MGQITSGSIAVAMFQDMRNRYNIWVKANSGKLPLIIRTIKNGPNFVALHTFDIMVAWFDKQDPKPTMIPINPTNPQKPTATVGTDLWVKQSLEYHRGTFINNKEDLYTTKNMVYADYPNLKHSKIDAVNTYIWSGGINCAEFCEYIMKPIFNCLGLVIGKNYWIAHGYVTCSNGKAYGHYWGVFSNKFALNVKMSPVNSEFYDLAGDAEEKRPQGTLICNEGSCYIDRYETDIPS